MDAVLSRLRIDRAATVACPADWSWETNPSAIGHHNLWLVHAGRGGMVIDGRRLELSRGVSLVMRPRPRVTAWHEPDDPLTVTYVHFRPVDARGHERRTPVRGLPPVSKRVASAALFEACARRIARLDTLPGGRLEAEAYLAALLIGLRAERDVVADEPGVEDAVREVAAWITEHPAEARTVPELAAMAGVGADHFAATFRRVIGRPPIAFAVAARLDRARHLLRHTRAPVGTIARRLGYSDAAYFTRQFRQHVGESPAAYRGRP